jgi:hypothetical protein
MAGPGRTNVYGFGQWTGETRRLDQIASEAESDVKNNQIQKSE